MGASRADPYLDYRFQVEIDALIVGGFSEVSGIRRELQTEEYQEGGVNHYTHTLPTRFSHPNVTLRRGLTDATELWEWTQAAVHGSITRRGVRVIVQDAGGEEVWGWEFRGAFPVAWEGPDLQGTGGTVAIETLELAHNGISRIDGLPR
ncbi:MAG: phage tail protein [Halobacteriales archaeon]|nr:phage tail protein [Halobacteriales archaeon]